MGQHHVAVWIDHEEAKIYQIDADTFEMSKVVAADRHVKRKESEQGKHTDVSGFFKDVAVALQGTVALLIVGPASAKLDFIRYLQRHDRTLEATICGVETLDHPSDTQLVAYVHHYFNDKDRAGKASV